MIERKVYITVEIGTEDFDKATGAFNSAIDAFFESLDSSEEAGNIQGYSVVDIEEK